MIVPQIIVANSASADLVVAMPVGGSQDQPPPTHSDRSDPVQLLQQLHISEACV